MRYNYRRPIKNGIAVIIVGVVALGAGLLSAPYVIAISWLSADIIETFVFGMFLSPLAVMFAGVVLYSVGMVRLIKAKQAERAKIES